MLIVIADTPTIIERVAAELGCPKEDAQIMLRSFANVLYDEIRKGNVVRMRGVFELGPRKMRRYIGSFGGESSKVSEHKAALYFKPGKHLMDAARVHFEQDGLFSPEEGDE